MAPNESEALRVSGRTNTRMNLEQDRDVLDTWFCSSLIPIILFGKYLATNSLAYRIVTKAKILEKKRHYSFTGWPKKRIDRMPLSVLETGYDIVGFWVARMVTVCHRFSFL